MKLRATILVDMDSPITEISDHAKRIDSVVQKLRDHYETVSYDIKERRDREVLKPSKSITTSKKHSKKPTELALSK
jgi:peptide subunit release factor 1 (eRF1)